jgi:hypothetical protein
VIDYLRERSKHGVVELWDAHGQRIVDPDEKPYPVERVDAQLLAQWDVVVQVIDVDMGRDVH